MPTFNSPPNWPAPPRGWTPPPDWKPDPAWGPPPAGWQLWIDDQPAAKKSWFARHKILTGVGAIAAIGIIGGAIGGNGADQTVAGSTAPEVTSGAQAATQPKASTTDAKKHSTANSTAKKPSQSNAADAAGLAKLGDTVKDGSLTFKVTKVSCGHSKIGDDYLNTKAQGQFCILSVKVKNVGDSSALLSDSNQKLINSKGQEFDADSEAGIYLGDSNTLFEEINPGNSVAGKIVFDIPKSQKPEVVELHDNRFFSEGVRVQLS